MARKRATPPPWPPEHDVTDERLAFLAARASLARRANPWWMSLVRIIEVGGPRGTRGMSASPSRGGFSTGYTSRRTLTSEYVGHRMAYYVVACDDLAGKLSAEERRALRATGELPEWFLPAVEGHVRASRADERRR
jgi:hypothetical protein